MTAHAGRAALVLGVLGVVYGDIGTSPLYTEQVIFTLDLEHASYFVSRITIAPTSDPGMRSWGKKLFIAMARNATSPIEHFGLPTDRTVMMGSHVAL